MLKQRLGLLSFLVSASLYAEESFVVTAMSGTLFVLILMVVVLIAYRLKQLASDVVMYQNLFAESPAAMIWIDRHDKIIAVNHSMQKLLGISTPELIGQVWYERLFTPETGVIARHKIHQEQKAGASISFESYYFTPKKKTLNLKLQMSRLSKKPAGYIISAVEF
ncbi:MAG: hypothetical protein DRG24_02070 [Epsilonproteobacteria bacterium]|nr:MAG: hypothetical protein DRG24_02070 [Campylobacterota bacterium]